MKFFAFPPSSVTREHVRSTGHGESSSRQHITQYFKQAAFTPSN